MADLNPLQYAMLLDQDNNPLPFGQFSAVSDDPAVCSIGAGPGSAIAAIGQAPGTATITATRNTDGATASVEVTVEALAVAFAIHLGEPAAKS